MRTAIFERGGKSHGSSWPPPNQNTSVSTSLGPESATPRHANRCRRSEIDESPDWPNERRGRALHGSKGPPEEEAAGSGACGADDRIRSRRPTPRLPTPNEGNIGIWAAGQRTIFDAYRSYCMRKSSITPSTSSGDEIHRLTQPVSGRMWCGSAQPAAITWSWSLRGNGRSASRSPWT
jgi:hypothetical protein